MPQCVTPAYIPYQWRQEAHIKMLKGGQSDSTKLHTYLGYNLVFQLQKYLVHRAKQNDLTFKVLNLYILELYSRICLNTDFHAWLKLLEDWKISFCQCCKLLQLSVSKSDSSVFPRILVLIGGSWVSKALKAWNAWMQMSLRPTTLHANVIDRFAMVQRMFFKNSLD